MDLKHLSKDQAARNESSYRPTHFDKNDFLNVSKCSEFLYSLWDLLEPSPLSPFDILDKHLLRLSLEKAFSAVKKNTGESKKIEYEKDVERMLDNINPEGSSIKQWKKFLLREIQPEDPAIIKYAKKKNRIGYPEHHVQVMARALLLLRVATGAVSLALGNQEIGKDDLEFWWKNIGAERGLWDSDAEPECFTDLWADIEFSLNDLQDWVKDQGKKTYSRFHREQASQVLILGEFERVALWGLNL